MTTRVCDRCGDPLESDALVLRVLDGQLPEARPRLDLCGSCGRKLGTWLTPIGPPLAEATPADDDPADDLEEG